MCYRDYITQQTCYRDYRHDIKTVLHQRYIEHAAFNITDTSDQREQADREKKRDRSVSSDV